jgi:hypothetical protein
MMPICAEPAAGVVPVHDQQIVVSPIRHGHQACPSGDHKVPATRCRRSINLTPPAAPTEVSPESQQRLRRNPAAAGLKRKAAPPVPPLAVKHFAAPPAPIALGRKAVLNRVVVAVTGRPSGCRRCAGRWRGRRGPRRSRRRAHGLAGEVVLVDAHGDALHRVLGVDRRCHIKVSVLRGGGVPGVQVGADARLGHPGRMRSQGWSVSGPSGHRKWSSRPL